MQKTKRVILTCLKNKGTCNRFQIRHYFQKTTKPTNGTELIKNLNDLEKAGCVSNRDGNYTLKKKGEELRIMLVRVVEILA